MFEVFEMMLRGSPEGDALRGAIANGATPD